MIKLLKKYKYLLPLLLSAAGIIIYLWLFNNSITSASVSGTKILARSGNVQEFPQNPTEKLSDIKYALQRIYSSSNLLSRAGNNIRSRNSAPQACKLRIAAITELTEISSCRENLFIAHEHHFVFQKYLKYSLPLRAGPFTV